MKPKARFFADKTESGVRCALCPRGCDIPNGGLGSCGVRGCENGKGVLPFYGHVTAMSMDPVEKKPLFHFRPGSSIFSVGFVGCNLRCPFCQNWRISRNVSVQGNRMTPADIVSIALRKDAGAIAFTYSEPLVHAEFLLDCMSLARRRGIANVLVTNGCAGGDAAEQILSLADAVNVDLKCFSGDTYSMILGAPREGGRGTVFDFIRLARAKDVHVEVTTLVVPGMNDSAGELDACADFIASVNAETDGPGIPWHLSAYRPDYQWKAPPTDPAFLSGLKKRAGKKLAFVYAGNVPGEENDTSCHGCGKLLLRRLGYRTEKHGLSASVGGGAFFSCSHCGVKTGIVS